MNNFYVLHHLVKVLNETCRGTSFRFSVSPHKNVWEGYFADDQHTHRLVFSANSSETALFLDHFRQPRSSNITTFFNDLTNLLLIKIELAANDRYISLVFSDGYKLLFQVFGNKPNIFLIRNRIITESFKSPDSYTGMSEPEPRPVKPTHTIPDSALPPKKQILRLDPKFPRHLIESLITEYHLDQKDPNEIQSLVQICVLAMLEKPEYRVLHNGNLCLLPQQLFAAENIDTFKDVNSAIRFAYYKASAERRLATKIQSIRPKINSRILKVESAIHQLQMADKDLERSAAYEEYGHILMANAHITVDGYPDFLVLPNYYDQNIPVKIPVDSRLTIAENAQRYYEKSSKTVRRVEESAKRLAETRNQLSELKKIQESLFCIHKTYEFDQWFKEHKSNLVNLGVLTKKSTRDENMPFRKLNADGYEIWLGKNAKSNDILTTRAHKEDIWMHARGVSGSHLVIRMNNQKEKPPKSVLLKAAGLAAWNSKARGSGLVPVIITKRKYVTKPKGSPPGTVRVQQESVELVEPAEL